MRETHTKTAGGLCWRVLVCSLLSACLAHSSNLYVLHKSLCAVLAAAAGAVQRSTFWRPGRPSLAVNLRVQLLEPVQPGATGRHLTTCQQQLDYETATHRHSSICKACKAPQAPLTTIEQLHTCVNLCCATVILPDNQHPTGHGMRTLPLQLPTQCRPNDYRPRNQHHRARQSHGL